MRYYDIIRQILCAYLVVIWFEYTIIKLDLIACKIVCSLCIIEFPSVSFLKIYTLAQPMATQGWSGKKEIQYILLSLFFIIFSIGCLIFAKLAITTSKYLFLISYNSFHHTETWFAFVFGRSEYLKLVQFPRLFPFVLCIFIHLSLSKETFRLNFTQIFDRFATKIFSKKFRTSKFQSLPQNPRTRDKCKT